MIFIGMLWVSDVPAFCAISALFQVIKMALMMILQTMGWIVHVLTPWPIWTRRLVQVHKHLVVPSSVNVPATIFLKLANMLKLPYVSSMLWVIVVHLWAFKRIATHRKISTRRTLSRGGRTKILCMFLLSE